jgi:hypothetical protein
MNDEERDKTDEVTGAAGDDRVVSERVQPLASAQPTVGAELDEADILDSDSDTPGQIGAAQPAATASDEGIRETLYKQPGSREQVPATEAQGTGLRSVEATTVLMERSGAEQITAERVTMERSGAKTLDAKSAQLDRSGVVALGSEHTVLLHSSAVQVVAEEARLTHSRAVFLQTERATLTDSRVGVFMGTAEGDVRATFTAQTAAIFGAALGAVFALLTIMLTRGRRASDNRS